MTNTTETHAKRIATLTANMDDFIFSFAGLGRLNVHTLSDELIYSIPNALEQGITPEALIAALPKDAI